MPQHEQGLGPARRSPSWHALRAVATQDSFEGRPATEATSSVAIVPFANLTGAANDEWIGAGIAETLSAALQPETFEVIAYEFLTHATRDRDLADDVSPDDVSVLALGRRVGARWVVSGGYQRLGDQIRITAWLVEAPTSVVVRSAKVDGLVADLFELQDRIANALVTGAIENVANATARPDPPVAMLAPDDGAVRSLLDLPTTPRMASPPSAVLVPPAPINPSPESGEPGDVAEIPSTAVQVPSVSAWPEPGLGCAVPAGHAAKKRVCPPHAVPVSLGRGAVHHLASAGTWSAWRATVSGVSRRISERTHPSGMTATVIQGSTSSMASRRS